MIKHGKMYRTGILSYRKDGMVVNLPTRTVYIDMFTRLSSCMFECCPFFGLTCNKCHYSVS